MTAYSILLYHSVMNLFISNKVSFSLHLGEVVHAFHDGKRNYFNRNDRWFITRITKNRIGGD